MKTYKQIKVDVEKPDFDKTKEHLVSLYQGRVKGCEDSLTGFKLLDTLFHIDAYHESKSLREVLQKIQAASSLEDLEREADNNCWEYYDVRCAAGVLRQLETIYSSKILSVKCEDNACAEITYENGGVIRKGLLHCRKEERCDVKRTRISLEYAKTGVRFLVTEKVEVEELK